MVQAIPAPSARGPAIRLRCLACHAPLDAGAEDTHVGGPLEVPSAPVDRNWYALVYDEVVGPLTRTQLTRMVESELLDADALVWHEGFAGWARLADTTSFARVVGGRRPAPRVPPVPMSPPPMAGARSAA